ncbi:nucleotidyltransferase family protein [Hyphobacterium sp. SN044]|uniref:nucleotidyltransferase family protein n=1 Tax=Hyphobacterium sp. SN044 TaxID=2912575 RepID=UPI001F287ADE|nr:nucleotidyltransferase family protein [Hyphobacterium sp. SN044]MCF8880921.1 nucleotidyltransferase family protein [Hyphobacterium sp. SN044]
MTRITTGMALAAGLGTRMRPLTNDRPKALVEVGGKVLLDHALDRFAAAGVDRAVVNIHHFAEKMRAHIEARTGQPDLVISDETGELLETGGGMVKALPLLGEDPVLVSNIDAVWVDRGAPELVRLMEAWDPARMDVLLLLAPMENTLGFDGAGDFFLEPDGRLDWRGDRASAPYAFAGAHIVHPRVFAGETTRRFSLTGIWKRLSTEGRLHGLPMEAFWMHVGDPRARDEAEARLASGMM